jgi:hypothetical protein
MGTVDRAMAIRDARIARGGATGNKRGEFRALSVRLDNEQYRRLLRFVTNHEDRTSQRVTHQAILEIALTEYLERNDPPLC